MNKRIFYSLMGRWVRKIRDRINFRRLRLSANGTSLFDSAWYRAKYPDIKTAPNPLRHYFQIGAVEGRDPNPLFSTKWYLERYPDVAQSGENPLAHYVRTGAAEGRDPHPLFSTKWYLARYPDVAKSGENPLAHYLKFGAAEGRDPNPLFSTRWYMERYPEVARSGENPLVHYLRYVRRWYLGCCLDTRGIDADPIASFFQFDSPKLQAVGQAEAHEGQVSANESVIYAQFPSVTQRDQRVEADWQFLSDIPATVMAERSPHEIGEQREASLNAVAAAGAKVRTVESGLAVDRPMNILFISFGPYDNNSALHITGFANSLAALGHRIVVSAMGSPNVAGDFSVPRFRCVTHQQLAEKPEIMTHYFSQTGNGAPDLIHCWTPRSVVRSLAQPIIEKFECPYIIHFEDNEVAVADAHGNADNAGRLANGTSKTADLVQSMPQFITGAAGATVIVDALRELLPEELPCHLLEPGVDTSLFLPGLEASERSRLCDALSVPADARIIVYPGNIHSANADDMFSLYVAVHALNRLGFKTHLIRTGTDHLPVIDPVFAVLTKRYVTNLGFIRREWLIEILKLADLFIQPGGPDDFNKYRLPSKIPEFLAMACPLILPNTNIGLKLEHGINALLMERGDAAEITECVKAILIDPALGTRIGQQGRRFAIDHFNWERSAKQLEGFYQKVLQRGHTRGAR